MSKHCASCNVIKSNRTSYRKVDWPGKLPGSWNRTWSKQYVSAVHTMTFFFLQRQTLHHQLQLFFLSCFAASVCCRYSIFSSLPCTQNATINIPLNPHTIRLTAVSICPTAFRASPTPLWVRCLFDRLQQILNFQIFRFWQSADKAEMTDIFNKHRL